MLWIIIPAARTPEERLRMRGEEVTPENLKEQIVSDMEHQTATTSAQKSSSGTGCLKVILILCLVPFLLPIAVALFVIVVVIFSLIAASLGVGKGLLMGFPPELHIDNLVASNTTMLWIGCIAGLFVLIVPIYAFIRFVRHREERMATSHIVALILIWIAMLALSIFAFSTTGISIAQRLDEIEQRESTRNGIALAGKWAWAELDATGWTLTKLDNVKDRLTSNDYNIKGMSPYMLAIERDDPSKPMSISLERAEYLTEGDYVLETLTSAEGKGIAITVRNNADSTTVATIDPTADGKLLANMSYDEALQMEILMEPDSTSWDELSGSGNNWQHHVSKPFHITDGEVTIIISADKSYLNELMVRHVILRKVD